MIGEGEPFARRTAVRNCRRASAAPASRRAAPAANSRPAAVNVNGAQPISLTGPGATRAPSAAAIICAPRQMPSIGRSAARPTLDRRDLVGDERIGLADS